MTGAVGNVVTAHLILQVVAEIVRLGTGLAGVYFAAAVVLAIAKGHLSAMAGEPAAMSEIVQQVTFAVVCLVVALMSGSLSGQVNAILAVEAQDPTQATRMWKTLAEHVLNAVILSTGATMGIGVAFGTFAAQLAAMAGEPGARATLVSRVGLVLMTGVLTLLSMKIANALLAVTAF